MICNAFTMSSNHNLYFQNILFLFLDVRGLLWRVRAFSSYGKWGYSPVVVNRLLLAVGFLVVKQGSRPCGLSSCLTRALLLHDMWHLPGPVMCPLQLAGRLLTTGPPGVPKTFSSTSPQNHIPVKCSVSIPPLSSISQPPIYFQSLWIYLF